MGLPEHPHEVAEVKCFTRPRSVFKDRKAMNSLAELFDIILMPFPAAAAVVETERFPAEDRGGRQCDGVTANVGSVLLDKVKNPARRRGRFEVGFAELSHRSSAFLGVEAKLTIRSLSA